MVAFVFKAIKPAKLQVDKFRVAILDELRAEGVDQGKELKKTVTGWKGDKPKFESLIGLDSQGASVATGPTGSDKGVQKWVWLDEGTRAHVIRARRARRLRFRSGGFRAKTSVGKFESGAGRAASGPYRFPLSVQHPGTKARGWSALLSKRRKEPFRRRLFAAMNKAAQEAF